MSKEFLEELVTGESAELQPSEKWLWLASVLIEADCSKGLGVITGQAIIEKLPTDAHDIASSLAKRFASAEGVVEMGLSHDSYYEYESGVDQALSEVSQS